MQLKRTDLLCTTFSSGWSYPVTSDEKDDSKFMHEKDIKDIAESLLTMLFEFKHRGAVEKAAETFQDFFIALQQAFQQAS